MTVDEFVDSLWKYSMAKKVIRKNERSSFHKFLWNDEKDRLEKHAGFGNVVFWCTKDRITSEMLAGLFPAKETKDEVLTETV